MWLLSKGVWAAVLCSDRFEPLCRMLAEANKVPDLPIVTVAHPIAGCRHDELRELARVAISGLVEVSARSVLAPRVTEAERADRS